MGSRDAFAHKALQFSAVREPGIGLAAAGAIFGQAAHQFLPLLAAARQRAQVRAHELLVACRVEASRAQESVFVA